MHCAGEHDGRSGACEKDCGLAPVAFDPDIAATAMGPVSLHPTRMRMRWLSVVAGNPYVAATVPAMVAGLPDPVTMLWRRGGNHFDRARRRRADADDDLGIRQGAGCEQSAEGECHELTIHKAFSFRVVHIKLQR